MRVDIVYRPLAEWTDPRDGARISTPFKAKWEDTIALLKSEAEHLRADLVVIQIVVGEKHIRADETGLKANAPVRHPGAVVSMDTKFGPLRLATDRYINNYWSGPASWRHNVRAIAKTLEALRAINRWGVVHRAEQYTGWLQLESGPVVAAPGAIALPAGMTVDEAALVLGELADLQTRIDPADEAVVKLAYRKAARRLHPDTGTRTDLTDWHRLNDAMRALGVNGEPS